jgi:hypothetical protein
MVLHVVVAKELKDKEKNNKDHWQNARFRKSDGRPLSPVCSGGDVKLVKTHVPLLDYCTKAAKIMSLKEPASNSSDLCA